jgi:hypothetical protein
VEQKYAAAGIEPPLEELLNDRIAQLVMRRNGIALTDVWRVVQAARERLAQGTAPLGPEERRPLDAVAEVPPAPGTDRQIRPSSG